jgi:hypothetical protein
MLAPITNWLGPGSEYLTGQTIAIDGGQYLADGGNFAHLSAWTEADWQRARGPQR